MRWSTRCNAEIEGDEGLMPLMPHDLILTTGVVLMEFGRRLSRVFKIVILITLIVEVPSATAVSPVNIMKRRSARGLRPKD